MLPRHFWAHVPKTAGTYTRARLLSSGLASEVVWNARKSHAPLAELPPAWLEGRRVVANIRDPWSWYVSWFHHHTRTDGTHHGQLEDRVGRGPVSFLDALPVLLEGPEDFAKPIRGFGSVGYQPHGLEQLENGWGLMRWMYYHITDDRVDDWIDVSDIDGGLSRLLSVDI
jgi:hypothetical protein